MVDGFATFFRVLVMSVGILAILPPSVFCARQEAETSEYHALLLFSIAGQCMMAAANDLIIVFIGLEISSIASYVLAGYLRDDKRSNEAALKYFLLGSFATAFFLYGVAIVYGATGTVNLSGVRLRHRRPGPSAGDFPGPGRRADVRRTGLQGLRRAIPDLGAGRLPGRAHAGLRVSLHRSESRRFRRFPAHFPDGLRPIGGGWEPLVWLARCSLHDHRQLRRAPADQRQAPAGL